MSFPFIKASSWIPQDNVSESALKKLKGFFLNWKNNLGEAGLV